MNWITAKGGVFSFEGVAADLISCLCICQFRKTDCEVADSLENGR